MRFSPSRQLTTALLSLSKKSRKIGMETTATTSPLELKPLILGGGLAGLAAAVALKGVCTRLQVWEATSKADATDVTAGAGAQLGPNGLRALRSICFDRDLVEQVLQAGSPLRGNAMLLPDRTNVMVVPDTTADTTVDGLPQVFLRWGKLRQILYEALTAENHDCQVTIQTGCGTNVAGYRVLPDGQHLQLVDADDNDLPHKPCNLIIGAEGVGSVMRYLVNSQQRTVKLDGNSDIQSLQQAANYHIRDTGRVNLKAIVPNSLQHYFDQTQSGDCLPSHTYAWFAPPASGLGLGCFCGPAGPNHSYWAVSVADDAETGKSFLDTTDGMHVEDIKLVLLNLLQNIPSAATEDNPRPPAFLVQALQDTDAARIRVSRSVESTGLGDSLVSKDGHVVLVGDAAHSMALSYGQNPNLAMEDAAVLARCLERHDNVQSALNAYSTSRIARCAEIQQRSDERARKAMKGEATEDVSQWIASWQVDDDDDGNDAAPAASDKTTTSPKGEASSSKTTSPKASSVRSS